MQKALTLNQILQWADAHRAATGEWPTAFGGSVEAASDESWGWIDRALSLGQRGLPGGDHLSWLLARERGAPGLGEQILAWAQTHRRLTGRWPTQKSGHAPGRAAVSWAAINQALWRGCYGLPRGDSLSDFLARHVGPRREPLTIARIVGWAAAHRERTGAWPHSKSGPVAGAPGLTWMGINSALIRGGRGLPGGTSLSQVLRVHRGAPQPTRRLTVEAILDWADGHRERMGRWPSSYSGETPQAGLTWRQIDRALRRGSCGLPAGSSLACLLVARRGKARKPSGQLTVEEVVGWAESHRQRTGQWPTQHSGPVADAVCETWCAIDQALRMGYRGMPGGDSLHRLLTRQGKISGFPLPPGQSGGDR